MLNIHIIFIQIFGSKSIARTNQIYNRVAREVACCGCMGCAMGVYLQRLGRFLCSQMPGPAQSRHCALIFLCSQIPAARHVRRL